VRPELSKDSSSPDPKKSEKKRDKKTTKGSKLIRGATAVLGLGMMAVAQTTGNTVVQS